MSDASFHALLSEKLLTVISDIKDYRSPYALSVSEPSVIIKELTKKAAHKLSLLSAGFALPPGYVAYTTVIPEIILLYRIQGHLVKDIAALYGKDNQVSMELLLYCLFESSQKQFLSNMVQETSTRVLIRPMTFHLLEKLVLRMSRQIHNRYSQTSISRLIPFSGLIFSAGKTYTDTLSVGKRAREVFAKDIFFGDTVDIQKLEVN